MNCFTDALRTCVRPAWPPQPDPRQPLSDALVPTTALVAARYFGGNLAQARRYRPAHWGQRPLPKSGFSRHLHRLRDVLDALFAPFGQALQHLNTDARYVLDPFPVAGCPNTRIPRCKLLPGRAYPGRCARKRSWFYGVKVQVIAAVAGVPVADHQHPSREADPTGLRQLDPDLPAGRVRYAAAAVAAYAHEDVFAEASGREQHTARRTYQQTPA